MSFSSTVSASTSGARECEIRQVDVAGNRIAYVVSGTGTPTVVLETGLGAESSEWLPVQAGLDGQYRVFRYDRPGRGNSAPPKAVRSASGMAGELRALLTATNTSGPYLLVGHSFGGLLGRLFAHLYPGDVCGLVLVESMHDRQFDEFRDAFPAPHESDAPDLVRMRTFWTRAWRDPAATPELIDLPASFEEARAIASLGDLPIVVLTASAFSHSRLFHLETRDELQARWNRLQGDLLKLSSRAMPMSAPASEHFVQRDAPQAVIGAVEAIVRMLAP